VTDWIQHIITFIAVFAVLSVVNVVVSFLRALLSTPPKPFELGRGALIYYGICFSFILTLIIGIII
jgi:high-affinity Fe2+/Pb2+ permease